MSTASPDPDLSVRLDWPVDPLTAPGDADAERRAHPIAADEGVSARLEALASPVARTIDPTHDLSGALDEIAERIDQLAAELSDALRAIDEGLRQTIDESVTGMRTAIMAMLASRQREAPAPNVAEDLTEIARTVTEALAASRVQGDVFADRVATEIQALRRRIPVKGKAGSSALDEATLEDLVTRLADEVEIRVAAAIKPKSTSRRKG